MIEKRYISISLCACVSGIFVYCVHSVERPAPSANRSCVIELDTAQPKCGIEKGARAAPKDSQVSYKLTSPIIADPEFVAFCDYWTTLLNKTKSPNDRYPILLELFNALRNEPDRGVDTVIRWLDTVEAVNTFAGGSFIVWGEELPIAGPDLASFLIQHLHFSINERDLVLTEEERSRIEKTARRFFDLEIRSIASEAAAMQLLDTLRVLDDAELVDLAMTRLKEYDKASELPPGADMHMEFALVRGQVDIHRIAITVSPYLMNRAPSEDMLITFLHKAAVIDPVATVEALMQLPLQPEEGQPGLPPEVLAQFIAKLDPVEPEQAEILNWFLSDDWFTSTEKEVMVEHMLSPDWPTFDGLAFGVHRSTEWSEDMKKMFSKQQAESLIRLPSIKNHAELKGYLSAQGVK